MMFGRGSSRELTILAARSSMGKSALAQYFVEQVAQQTGQTVVIYSLEMGRGYLADRFLANKLGVGVDELRRGYVRRDKLAGMAVEGYQHWQHIYIDDTPNLTSFDVMTKTRRLKRKTGSLGLVVVDFDLVGGYPGPAGKPSSPGRRSNPAAEGDGKGS